MTYCYKCKKCDWKVECDLLDIARCWNCDEIDSVVRDYKREAKGLLRENIRATKN